jgi:hypothetical protein
MGSTIVESLDMTGNIAIDGALCAKKIMCRGNLNACEWPDYVFENAYSLMPLKDLEAYVKSKKHLPGMPSAEEVVEKGIDMQEMNIQLLKKVEELHLYVLRLEKRIGELESK